MNPTILYVQKRAHRAGAQTCLARIFQSRAAKDWSPLLVSSQIGWLTGEAERAGIPVIYEQFPSSRSLQARLYWNRRFARRVAAKVKSSLPRNLIVHANDHLEGLLGLAVAEQLAAPKAIFLRSPGMTRDDYFKYRCNEYDLVAAVGDELQSRVQAWDPTREIKLIHDGITEEEFSPPKLKPKHVPHKILVIGSHLDWKGWADLTEALYLLEQKRALPPIRFDFTGNWPSPGANDLKLRRLSTHCNFLGRVEAFRDLVRLYDLIINPTRMESFGMAAIEVLAAGVPLLSSRTGVIEQVQQSADMLFPPNCPQALAAALKNVFDRWAEIDFEPVRCQENIKRRFSIEKTITRLSSAYDQLLAAIIP